MRHLINFPDGKSQYVWLADDQKVEDYLATLQMDTQDIIDEAPPQVVDLNPKNEHLAEQISASLEAGNIIQINLVELVDEPPHLDDAE